MLVARQDIHARTRTILRSDRTTQHTQAFVAAFLRTTGHPTRTTMLGILCYIHARLATSGFSACTQRRIRRLARNARHTPQQQRSNTQNQPKTNMMSHTLTLFSIAL